jgi:hypothetical protein
MCEGAGVILLHHSGLDGFNDFEKFFMSDNKNDFQKNYPLNIYPTSDESPFFFQFFKFTQRNANLNFFNSLKVLGLNNILSQAGVLAILSLFIIALLLSLILILLPLIIGDRESLRHKEKWAFFLYFSCLGFAYIFIEISQIQRYILFLGQPIYSISIVLFTFLTSSGLGSRVSGFFNKRLTDKIAASILGIFIIVLFYFFIQRDIFDLFLSSKFLIRVIISIIMLAPLGFLMGMLFPFGIRTVEENGKIGLVPWLWASNGICSVLGSILASFFAMQIGFSKLLLLAAVIYLMAILAIRRAR